MFQVKKPEKLKPLTGQLGRQLAKSWLAVIEREQTNFGLDHKAVLQLYCTITDDRQFAALNVDFKKVDATDVGDVV